MCSAIWSFSVIYKNEIYYQLSFLGSVCLKEIFFKYKNRLFEFIYRLLIENCLKCWDTRGRECEVWKITSGSFYVTLNNAWEASSFNHIEFHFVDLQMLVMLLISIRILNRSDLSKSTWNEIWNHINQCHNYQQQSTANVNFRRIEWCKWRS